MQMTDALIKEVEGLVERLVESNNRETAARRLLLAAEMLWSERELMVIYQDTSRRKQIHSLMTRVIIRAGKLLGDQSREHQWLIELQTEADSLKAESAAAGR